MSVEICQDNTGHPWPVNSVGTAKDNLVDAGCLFGRRRDRYGVTRRGWFQDDVYLADNDRDALAALKGN